MKDNLDFILTIREPGRQKYHFSKSLGVQKLEDVRQGQDFVVVSPFEYNTSMKNKPKGKILISNSLEIRKQWLQKMGGRGAIPSPIQKGHVSKSNENEVLLIGTNQISPAYWQKVSSFDFWGVPTRREQDRIFVHQKDVEFNGNKLSP